LKLRIVLMYRYFCKKILSVYGVNEIYTVKLEGDPSTYLPSSEGQERNGFIVRKGKWTLIDGNID